jgi:cobalt-zinc-cadmium efflux system protein
MEKKRKRITSHRHHHHQPVSGRNLLIATLLNLVITVAEIAGGIAANSLALLSDALHNLSDTMATFIAYIATIVSRKKADRKKTFGYRRVEIMAAVLNAVILIVVCVFLFREAYERMLDPQPVKSMIMIVVAMVGLMANVMAVVILRKDAGKSLNVKAAYVHLIGDSLSSLLVVLGAVIIQLFGFLWIDPLVTILIGVYLIRESYVILKEAVNILMQATPGELNLDEIKIRVEKISRIRNLHHIHAWSLSDNELHFEGHIEVIEDYTMSEVGQIRDQVEQLLKTHYGITHITLQFEYHSGHDNALLSNSG